MSERIGRCEGAVMAACEARGGQIASSPYGGRRAIAAAIDRLAADVAAIKEAVCGNSPKTSDSSAAAPQPAAPAAGWLTERKQHALRHILAADVEPAIRSILARAGSPPVVEVPELGFLGDMTGREQGIVLAYRDALDAAGVKWKEVGR